MNVIIFTLIFLIAIGLFGFFILWFVYMIDSIVYRHDLPTSQRATKVLCKIILEYKSSGNFYDLGCSRGEIDCRIKKKLPLLCVYAIDNNFVRIFFAKIRACFFRQNIKFLREDIFNLNLSNADIIYTYLWYDIMPSLEKKLQKELKQGAIVITNTSNFPNWKPIQKIITYHKASKTPDFETLFVYQKT